MMIASSYPPPLHFILFYITHVCYIRRRQTLEIKRVIYTLKACVSKYNNYITCSFHLEESMLLVNRLTDI
jgi:hypothetical protein